MGGWIVHSNGGRGRDRGNSRGVKCEKMPPGGQRTIGRHVVISLCAACTGCILDASALVTQATLFASALPARGASDPLMGVLCTQDLCLGAACTGCITGERLTQYEVNLCLGAACTGCIDLYYGRQMEDLSLCLGAACTGCIL